MANSVKQYDVLLTYGWCRVGYGVLRSLSKRGIKVLVGDASLVGMCRFSNLKTGFFKYPSPYNQPEEYVKTIKEVYEKSGAKVIIAPHEESFPLIKNRQLFPDSALHQYHTWDSIALANDKERSTKMVLSLGLPVPKTVDYEEFKEIENKLNESNINYPLVIKLRRSNSAKGVFYVNSKKELIEIIKQLIEKYKIPKGHYPLIQEYIDGQGWGVSGVWKNGEPLALVTHKRLHEKTLTGGTSTLRISQSNPLLEEYALKIMSHLKWQGVAMIEFKFNEKTKKGWFIEINPRLWGSLQLGIHAGVDIPWILYNLAVDNPIKAPKQKDGVVCKWLIGEGILVLKYLASLNFQKALSAIQVSENTVYDDFFWDDPAVLFGEGGYYLEKFLRSGFNTNPEEEGMVGY